MLEPAFDCAGTGAAASTRTHGYRDTAATFASGNADAGPAVASGHSSKGLGYGSMFFLWQTWPQGGSMFTVGRNISVHVARIVS